MKKYKPCGICPCHDCKTGRLRDGSWPCPVLKKQICEVCCHYDMDAGDAQHKGKQMRVWCKKIKCKRFSDS